MDVTLSFRTRFRLVPFFHMAPGGADVMFADGYVYFSGDEPGERYIQVETSREVDSDTAERLRNLSPSDPPDEIQILVRALAVEHSEKAARTLKIFRWRLGGRSEHRVVGENLAAEWSEDRKQWHPLPAESTVQAPESTWVAVNLPLRAHVAEMFAAGDEEPVAHELLREAEGNLAANPRSALVLAVAALETGIKAYIATMVPDARWLAFEAPSPPVFKILSEYLPTLESRDAIPIPPPPKRLRTLVRKAVEARNDLAHKGEVAASLDLEDLVDGVREILYMFDFFSGREWALALADPESRDDWGKD